MTQRGWTTDGLPLIGDDEKLWTVEEAARFLDRPLIRVKQLVAAIELEPVGTRLKGGTEKRGRQPRVYRAIDFIKVYDALSKVA